MLPSLAEDILMALRYFYYIKARSLVPDPVYDGAEKEYMSRESVDAFTSPLNNPGSDGPDDYTDRVKALALYIGMCDLEKLRAHRQAKRK